MVNLIANEIADYAELYSTSGLFFGMLFHSFPILPTKCHIRVINEWKGRGIREEGGYLLFIFIMWLDQIFLVFL